jgi:dTDP-4-amino-4,6-dideoxygalactose transaminase
MNIAKKHNLKVIEDCAHTIGGEYEGKKLGTFGDIGMFSFGSDKVVSCVRGGALITNDTQLANRLAKIQEELPESTRTKTLQFLANILIFMLFKPLYQYGVGKWSLAIFKKLNITGRIIYEKEKKGEQVSFYPSKLPNALAEILLDQLKDLEQTNKHRKEISKLYQDLIQDKTILPVLDSDTIPLRFNLIVNTPEKLHALSKQNGIMLGDWYDAVIAPSTAGLEHTDYIFGSCPQAEKYAQMSINLPTSRHISQTDAKRIVDILNN